MLDPRIYRGAFVPLAFALIVFLFSLVGQPGPLSAGLAPDAFNGTGTVATQGSLAARYGTRRPGSATDVRLAGEIASRLSADHYTVTADTFSAQTALGTRRVSDVVASLPGFSSRRVVIVAPRDALRSADRASLTGTAVMLELARVLSERTLQRTVVFASIGAGAGGAGARRLAGELGGPVDAVLVLGDLSGTRLRPPLVVPWSAGPRLAPPALRNTVAAALLAETGARAGGTGLAAQFARLAVPFTLGAQGPFIDSGMPAVLLSTAGERGAPAGEPVDASRLATVGRAALRVVTALEQGPDLPAPRAYLLYDRKVIPAWAVRWLVLAALLPAIAVAVDGLARAGRRRLAVVPRFAWTVAAAVPVVLFAAVLRLAGAAGVLPAPPGPVGPEVPGPSAGAVVALVIASVVMLIALRWWWPGVGRLLGTRREPSEEAAGVALLCAASLSALLLWSVNPFAAALVVPAVHLWSWATEPEIRLRRPVAAVFVLAGLVAPALVAAEIASSFGLGPATAGWTAAMMLAGGHLPLLAGLAWCGLAGCGLATVALVVRLGRRTGSLDAPVTVRGPVTYAGPGSLGGTESALARRR